MPGLRVRAVRTRADLERFVAFPYRLNRGDPRWTPPLRRDVFRRLSREKNPFFEHGDALYLLAERNGDVVGRVAAIENQAHNAYHQDRAGFFGFFEAVEDPLAVLDLLAQAGAWLRERGLVEMLGPVSFSTNDECGVLVDGFETPPTLLTPHNPAYYDGLLEWAGMRKAKDLFQWQRDATVLPERLERGVKALARRKRVSVRHLDKGAFDEDLQHIKRLYNGVWERNWGFVPMTDAEIEHLAAELKPIIQPDLVAFAERDGEVIGFAIALPDLNVALRRNPGGRLFPGILKILWAARRIHRLRFLLLGLSSEFRGSGVDALMILSIWRKAKARGFVWGEAGWILEDNLAMNNAMQRMGFEHYKTLRLYTCPL